MNDYFTFDDYGFDELYEAAVAIKSATRSFNSRFDSALERVEPMITWDVEEKTEWSGKVLKKRTNIQLNEKFWEMLSELRSLYFSTQWTYLNVEKCSDEFVRRSLFKVGDYENMMRFVVSYDKLKECLRPILWDVAEDYGDDGFGDLVDSIPLSGRSCLMAILNGEVSNMKQLESCVEESVVPGSIWANNSNDGTYKSPVSFVIRGENYISMHLNDELRRRFYSAGKLYTKEKNDD